MLIKTLKLKALQKQLAINAAMLIAKLHAVVNAKAKKETKPKQALKKAALKLAAAIVAKEAALKDLAAVNLPPERMQASKRQLPRKSEIKLLAKTFGR